MAFDEHVVRVALADAPYDVHVKPGLLAEVGPRLAALSKSSRIALMTDSTVAPIAGPALKQSCAAAGVAIVAEHVVPAGEDHKTLATIEAALDTFLRAKVERSTIIVALGGGVIGDMAGFTAAILLRGVPFVQVPTTLLAMVDASVGGKTGVNHAVGKNLIGAFHQPLAVFADVALLRTLPKAALAGGLAECIKHDLIRDADGFSKLEQNLDAVLRGDELERAALVAHNVRIKAAVVERDPLEQGERAHLNFGHTFGHAIEKVSHFGYSHGESVALGMVAAGYLSRQLGLIDEPSRRRMVQLIARAALPTAGLSLDPQAVVEAMAFDKKVKSGRIRFVLLDRIGSAIVRDDVPPALVREAVESLPGLTRVALLHWLALSLTDGIGPILGRRLIEAAGGVEAACAAREPLLRTVEGIGTAKSGRIAASLKDALDSAQREIERAAGVGATILCPDDDAYPPLLHSIPDPPLVLYVRGTLEPRDLHAVAIVGSRRCSYYGREQSERIAALLGGAGVTVVSGGARGVDSAVHRGALAAPQGRTLAVLGSGVNVTYPPENHALFAQIANGRGAVISEFPIDAPPAAENFPRRNRIVSGISRGVLVVEADLKSGALITARCAADDHGRPVFALPGRVDNPLSGGPHMLIRDGAILVTGIDDILAELGPLPHPIIDAATPPAAQPPESTPAEPDLFAAPATPLQQSDVQTAILNCLDEGPQSVDQIIERTAQPAGAVLRELTFLTLRAQVRRIDGQTFARSRQ